MTARLKILYNIVKYSEGSFVLFWYVCFFVSAAIIAVTIPSFVYSRVIKKAKSTSVIRIIFIGFFFALLSMLLPIQCDKCGEGFLETLKGILMSINRTMRSFALTDIDFLSQKNTVPSELYRAYSVLLMALCFICPFLSLSYILSLFSKVRASVKFALHYRKDLFVFSQLNEESIALAEDIMKNRPKAGIVFCEVNDSVRDKSIAYVERASMLNANCVNRDILSVNFNAHSKKSRIYFFTIKENEQTNTNEALELIGKYKNRRGTRLYLFSTLIESRLVLANFDNGFVRVRRIDKAQTFINRFLYDEGQILFEHALPPKAGESEKEINVLILGLGKCGNEMLRALSWYCQMEGYRLRIDAVDIGSSAEDRLRAECSELLDEHHNGVRVEGESYYDIRFHSGMDFRSVAFSELMKKLDDITFAFVALGRDNDNVEACVTLRKMFERTKTFADIYAVLRSNDKKQAVSGIRNFKGQEYLINSIGDIRSVFTEKEIMHSEIEEEALRLHMEWGEEEDFWRFEYNHRSSIARAIHRNARKSCDLFNHPDEKRSPEELKVLSTLEHKRWNAFMRSEGYIYSGSLDPSSRNDLGKLHNDLVSYNLLAEDVKKKDDEITIK